MSGREREESRRWLRVQELFHEAIALEGTERDRFLDEACRGDTSLRDEVQSLIDAERAAGGEGFITDAVGAAATDVTAANAVSWVGRTVGHYRLVEELGRGGMGTIYLAERADATYEARVAIKFVRGGIAAAELVSRFLAERQILANLTHPNIARLLDGGATDDGTPYLVMERIEGEPIDEYCDRCRLDVPQRLALFCQVCDAVHYAHRHLVVHRDIKPSNILVTPDGTPKLLDFGVAKLLAPTIPGADAITATGERLLTPAYASPEQVRGEPITTATDVYSLGVLLYRMITGSLPYGNETLRGHELAVAVITQEPSPPSRVARRDGRTATRLTHDVDAVVLKALEKDPARRYASVEGFAADVRRYLGGLPVHARPATRAYRLGKFLVRHRRGALGTLAAVASVVVLTTFYVARLARERDFANAERLKAAQVAEFLERLFLVSDPTEARGQSITAREVVDSAAARLPVDLAEQPEVQAAMLYTLGGVYLNLGLYRDAEPLLQRGVALRRADQGVGSPTVGDFLTRIGTVRMMLGDTDSAAVLLRDAIARLGDEYPDADRTVMARLHLANAQRRAGRLEAADSALERALEDARGLPNDSVLTNVLRTRAALYLNQRRGTEAEPVAREALDRVRERVGPDHPDAITALNNLGQALYQQTRFAEAEPLMREVLQLRLRVAGETHPLTGTAWNNLAALLQAQGRPDEAAAAAREALAIYRAAYGERHQRVTLAMTNLASMLLASGRPQEAERMHRDALAIKIEMLQPGHIDIAASYNNLAHVLEDEGRLQEAEALYHRAVTEIERGVGVETEVGSIFLSNLGGTQEALGKMSEAEATLRRALAIQRDVLPEQHGNTATTLSALGGLLIRTGRAAEAEPLLQEALGMRTAVLSADHWAIQVTRNTLGAAFAALDRPAEAESLLTSSTEALRARFGAEDERVQTALQRTLSFYEAVENDRRIEEYRALLAGAN